MKNKSMFRALISALLIAVLLAASLPSMALAEDRAAVVEGYEVEIDMSLAENAFFARYGLTVYLDNLYVGSIDQGGRMHKLLGVTPGDHTISIYAGKSSVPCIERALTVNGHLTVQANFQTHQRFIDMTRFNVVDYKPEDVDASQRVQPLPGDEEKALPGNQSNGLTEKIIFWIIQEVMSGASRSA